MLYQNPWTLTPNTLQFHADFSVSALSVKFIGYHGRSVRHNSASVLTNYISKQCTTPLIHVKAKTTFSTKFVKFRNYNFATPGNIIEFNEYNRDQQTAKSKFF